MTSVPDLCMEIVNAPDLCIALAPLECLIIAMKSMSFTEQINAHSSPLINM